MITDEQVEEIILLHMLTGMTLVDSAYAVVPGFDGTDFNETAALQIRIFDTNKKLDSLYERGT